MYKNVSDSNVLRVDNKQVEDAKECVYLGSSVGEDGGNSRLSGAN